MKRKATIDARPVGGTKQAPSAHAVIHSVAEPVRVPGASAQKRAVFRACTAEPEGCSQCRRAFSV